MTLYKLIIEDQHNNWNMIQWNEFLRKANFSLCRLNNWYTSFILVSLSPPDSYCFTWCKKNLNYQLTSQHGSACDDIGGGNTHSLIYYLVYLVSKTNTIHTNYAHTYMKTSKVIYADDDATLGTNEKLTSDLERTSSIS